MKTKNLKSVMYTSWQSFWGGRAGRRTAAWWGTPGPGLPRQWSLAMKPRNREYTETWPQTSRWVLGIKASRRQREYVLLRTAALWKPATYSYKLQATARHVVTFHHMYPQFSCRGHRSRFLAWRNLCSRIHERSPGCSYSSKKNMLPLPLLALGLV